MNPPIRVVVVDDSPIFLETITTILQADGDIHVVATAVNGREALAKLETLRPDLFVMDINMPVMNGLEAVEHIMATSPTPILVLTASPTHQGAKASFDALSRGALELVSKQSLTDPSRAPWLRERVRLLAGVTVVYRARRSVPSTSMGKRPAVAAPVVTRPTTRFPELVRPPAPVPSRRDRVSARPQDERRGAPAGVGLVASTGGPPVLAQILAGLPEDFSLPVLIVQHLANGFATHLGSWLASSCRLPVRIARHGMRLEPATVFLAPDDAHLEVTHGGCLSLDRHSPPIDGHRPSGTRLLTSMATVWRSRAVGVVLTGMGSDGVAGLAAIRAAGGSTLAQDQATSAVFGMPRGARDAGAAEAMVPAQDIAQALCSIAERGTFGSGR